MFEYAHDDYSQGVNASFASAKAECEKVRAAKAGLATPSYKPTVGTSSTSGTAEAMAGSTPGPGEWLLSQPDQLTRIVGLPFANLIPPQGVPGFPSNLW